MTILHCRFAREAATQRTGTLWLFYRVNIRVYPQIQRPCFLGSRDRIDSIQKHKSVARQDGKLVISTPKTPNSIRTVLLPTDTVKLLVEEHEKHPANPYLFPSPRTGETWDPDGFRRLHDRIIKEIGAEHVRFHDMRHTFATLSLKSGVDVRTLSETLGHFSAGFTLSTYVHSTPGMKQSAADAIGNTIRNAI